MSKAQTIIISIIILILLGILAYFSYQALTGNKSPNQTATTTATSTDQNGYPSIIVAKYQYTPNTNEYIVAGTLQTPTICDLLKTNVNVDQQTDPVTATIQFNLTNNSDTCAQAIGEQRFKVTFNAPENANIIATINGTPVKLNLIPVPKGENLDDFQIYVKG